MVSQEIGNPFFETVPAITEQRRRVGSCGRGVGRFKFGGCRGETHNSMLHSFVPRSTITGIQQCRPKALEEKCPLPKTAFSAALRIPPTLSSYVSRQVPNPSFLLSFQNKQLLKLEKRQLLCKRFGNSHVILMLLTFVGVQYTHKS